MDNNRPRETKVYTSREVLSADLEYVNCPSGSISTTIMGLQHACEKTAPESYASLWHPAAYRGIHKMALQVDCGLASRTGYTLSHLLKRSALFYKYLEFDEAEIILLDLENHVRFTVLLPETAEKQTFTSVTAILNKYLHRYLDENGLTRDRLKKMLQAYAALGKTEPEAMELIRKAIQAYGSMALNDGFMTVISGWDGMLRAEPVMPEGLPADTEEEIKNSLRENGYRLLPASMLPYGYCMDTAENRRILAEKYGKADAGRCVSPDSMQHGGTMQACTAPAQKEGDG